jgi:hypothetical protein
MKKALVMSLSMLPAVVQHGQRLRRHVHDFDEFAKTTSQVYGDGYGCLGERSLPEQTVEQSLLALVVEILPVKMIKMLDMHV